MSLLTYNNLVRLVENGVIENADPDNINGASIDVRLGPVMRREQRNPGLVDLTTGGKVKMRTVLPSKDSGLWVLPPGGFALFETHERFNLPDDIAIEFKLRSSMARAGIDHALAGWGDPGWHNSTLTLELRNNLEFHRLGLRPGMRIGQIICFRGDLVPSERSYRTRGRYNNQQNAAESKGV